jgi:hypothetical protein
VVWLPCCVIPAVLYTFPCSRQWCFPTLPITCQSRLKVWASVIPGKDILNWPAHSENPGTNSSRRCIQCSYLFPKVCSVTAARFTHHKILNEWLRGLVPVERRRPHCIASSPPSQPEKIRSTAACRWLCTSLLSVAQHGYLLGGLLQARLVIPRLVLTTDRGGRIHPADLDHYKL